MSDLLHHDEDAVDPDGPNDIDVSRMVTNGTANNDYTIGGNPEFQNKYDSYYTNTTTFLVPTSKGRQCPYPRMTFTVATNDWEAPTNRLPSRHISVEKHAAYLTR